MILAAGLGTRMRPLTDTVPKPLLPVGGKPLIVWHLEALARLQVTEVVINVSHLGQQIMQTLGSGNFWGLRLYFSEETEPLETAGGIIQALPRLGDQPFLLINGDVWWQAVPFWQYGSLKTQHLAHLLLVPNPEHHLQGDFGLLSSGEVVLDGGIRRTFSGISLISPELFANLAPGVRPLGPLLRQAVSRGQVSGAEYAGVWVDVGTPARLNALDRHLRQGLVPQKQAFPSVPTTTFPGGVTDKD